MTQTPILDSNDDNKKVKNLDMKYISKFLFRTYFNFFTSVTWYEDTKEMLDKLEWFDLSENLDVSIAQHLDELAEYNQDEYISPNMKFAYSINVYNSMYSSWMQTIIDYLEQSESPISKWLWKIKAGYSKLVNGYFSKIKEVVHDSEIQKIRNNITDLQSSIKVTKKPISTVSITFIIN
jgi:hypothetical protein